MISQYEQSLNKMKRKRDILTTAYCLLCISGLESTADGNYIQFVFLLGSRRRMSQEMEIYRASWRAEITAPSLPL
jgi:hypothetical protein